MGFVTSITTLLSTELLDFGVGDYIISKAADLGSGRLWKEIKKRLPEETESLEGQLYDAVENSVKRYTAFENLDEVAPACEIIYGLWVKNGHLAEEDVKNALAKVNPHYISTRNVELWYRQFYEEIVKGDKEQLFRWYVLHSLQKSNEQGRERDEKIMREIRSHTEKNEQNIVTKDEQDRMNSQLQLKSLILRPIMEESFCLQDVYISLHGKRKALNTINDTETFIVDTTSYIWDWHKGKKSRLMFLHGEPGSGKSSLVKTVAATIAGSMQHKGLVVFIDLYHLSFNKYESPIEILEVYIRKKYAWFFDTALEGNRLLILDGLDEIRFKVYENASELIRELGECDWDIPWSCIVSGRTQIMRKSTEDTTGEELEILPLFMDEYELKKRADKADDVHGILEEDLREIYWNKLLIAFGIQQEMPLQNEQFDELSKSPLLLFLVLWTIKYAGIKFTELKNTAELYETIFRYIYTREYNRPTKEEMYFISREYQEYQQMLHYLGGCAYKNNSRAVSVHSIFDYCKIMRQESLCERWIQKHRYENPSKLVLLFFLREEYNEMDWQQSEIEFIHKTFYEYLAAIAVIEFLYKNTKEIKQDEFVTMMFYQFSDNLLDNEILRFMDEILQNSSLIVEGECITDEVYCKVLSTLFTWGYHTNYPIIISETEKSEKKICVKSYQECMKKIRVYEENLKKLLEIITGRGGQDEEENSLLDLSCMEFIDATMNEWIFDGTNLEDSHFDSSIISGASFKGCRMRGVNMLSAIADRAEFSDAELEEADFSGTQLVAANFTEAVLEETDFEIADLEGAYFCNTKLLKTKFPSANLTAANFDEALIVEADFHGADLTRADFSNAIIESANWENCIMEGTKLNGVKLAQFDLDDPDIIEMLALAELQKADWTGVTEQQKMDLLGNQNEELEL